MTKKSLQRRLVDYLKKRPHVHIAKGALADLAREKMGVTGETVGRRLRVLHEASTMTPTLAQLTGPEHAKALQLLEGGTIEVEHRDHQHCWYWYVPPATKRVRKIEYTDTGVREVWVDEPTK